VASVILLDTHVVVWLYDDPQGRIPKTVWDRLNDEQLAVSPFVRLELAYLHEIGRITVSAEHILDELMPRLEMTLTDPSTATVCAAAVPLSWTRDPFDRLLAAEATCSALPLVTKDKTIREHLPLAWWA
jgi:PIN domain nuclease of toxin-antitoxin system